jgi:hypothetical protein
MFSEMGPMDITCDAPHYSFVEACEKVGFQSPLDVRWCRTRHFLGGQREPGGFHPLRWLFGGSQNPKITCTCGQPLPRMESCVCIWESGKEAHYLLGQCSRCRTMFWEEVAISSLKENESET